MFNENPPISKVRNLLEHPKFKPKIEISESYQNIDQNVEEKVEEREENYLERNLLFPRSVCAQCEYVLRPRRGLFKKMDPSEKWLCAASPREAAYHPQTGELGYLPFGTKISSHAQKEPAERCLIVNPTGECRKFKLKF